MRNEDTLAVSHKSVKVIQKTPQSDAADLNKALTPLNKNNSVKRFET
jgi:hypothetical protein